MSRKHDDYDDRWIIGTNEANSTNNAENRTNSDFQSNTAWQMKLDVKLRLLKRRKKRKEDEEDASEGMKTSMTTKRQRETLAQTQKNETLSGSTNKKKHSSAYNNN